MWDGGGVGGQVIGKNRCQTQSEHSSPWAGTKIGLKPQNLLDPLLGGSPGWGPHEWCLCKSQAVFCVLGPWDVGRRVVSSPLTTPAPSQMKWPINEDLSPITSCEGQVGQATEGKNKTEVTVGSEAPGESCPLPAQKNDTTLEAS